MIARIIDLDHEREVKNSYSSGYEEGRIKGQIYIVCLLFLFILIASQTPLWAVWTLLGYLKDFIVYFGWLLIKIVKFIIDFVLRVNISIN